MAKKNTNKVREEVYENGKGGLGALAWVGLALVAVLLMVSVIHMSGIFSGAEENIYSATRGVPVVGALTGWMHHEEGGIAADLSPSAAVSAKDIANDLMRAGRKIQTLEKQNKELTATLDTLADAGKKIERLEKKLKDMEEYGGVVPAEIFEEEAPGLPASAASGASPRAAAMSAASSENFRLVAKIFEKIESDTAVDILNNMTEDEQVKILGAMKEGTVAEILTAFDPMKSAKLTRMLAGGAR